MPNHLARREFMLLLGGAVAGWPVAAWAQQPQDQVRTQLGRIVRLQAEHTAKWIVQFIKDIESQVGWTTQLPWTASAIEQRRFDALRLLRQVPAITGLSQLDSHGKERMRMSRGQMDQIEPGTDFSKDSKFTEALSKRVYYGPVYFSWSSEPHMTLAMAGARRDAGVSVAEVNLRSIQDLVTKIMVGEHGVACVIDNGGRVIAHSNVMLVQKEFSSLADVKAVQPVGTIAAGGPVQVVRDVKGRVALATFEPVGQLGWLVFVQMPIE